VLALVTPRGELAVPVRHHAKKYGIDPDRIGAAGASAGGQLALMVGCAGRAGTPEAKDPVERE